VPSQATPRRRPLNNASDGKGEAGFAISEIAKATIRTRKRVVILGLACLLVMFDVSRRQACLPASLLVLHSDNKIWWIFDVIGFEIDVAVYCIPY
jgi:hypothetical protein